jgi:peptide/nickel transport system substrate-binding protein
MPPRQQPEDWSIPLTGTHDRRSFLKLAGAATLTASSATVLAACGDTAHTSSTEPKRGGTLRAGITGGGASDTLNPFHAVTNADFARINQIFEPLVRYDTKALPELWLAEELTPNKDFTLWTVRVRLGVTFHNGKPLTAADVAYTLRMAVNPKVVSNGASLISTLDVSGLKILDNRTLAIPFTAPFASFRDILPAYWFNIIPEGYALSTSHPVGTGPFKYQSFVAGQESVFVRNENYWRPGLPYLDSIVISDYADETSQLNALNAGQVDVVNALSGTSIGTVQSSGGKISNVNGSSWSGFVMNESAPPFNDVRVRQALRALVDREQMRKLVFNGYGELGNDVFSIADPVYDRALPQRQQDIELAKSLLRKAGHDGLTVQLVNADVGPGLLLMGQVLAQQAKAAGVTITLNQVTPSALFGPNFTKWPFAVDYWYYLSYFAQVSDTTLPNSAQPETHFNNPRYAELYRQAQAAQSEQLRTEIAHEMQTLDYNEGGYIIPFFLPTISGIAQNVHGTQSSLTGVDFANFDFSTTWKD